MDEEKIPNRLRQTARQSGFGSIRKEIPIFGKQLEVHLSNPAQRVVA